MPTCPEAIVLMLATVRIGAIHSVVFAGFGARRARRPDPRQRLAARPHRRRHVPQGQGRSPLKPIVDDALAVDAGAVERVVVLEPRQHRSSPERPAVTSAWAGVPRSAAAAHSATHEAVEANEPAFILATSGTTAKPKLAVHTHGGYQVYIDAMGRWVFGLGPDDMWWSTSDIGWIVGHSYIVYAPLLVGRDDDRATKARSTIPSPETVLAGRSRRSASPASSRRRRRCGC